MLVKVKTLKGYKLDAKDGEIGKVKEFYFDDNYWAVRYLVADTGNWLTGRRVLISPYALGAVNANAENISVAWNKKQIEESPSLASDKPVSRQFEEAYYGYFGWPGYWTGTLMWGQYPYILRDGNKWTAANQQKRSWDPHLRSSNDVTGHNIQAKDGEIGHLEDLIIDDETWAIRYLIIDTKNWWPGKKVLVSPLWIDNVSWEEKKVFVALSQDSIKRSPEYSDELLLTRDYELELYRHYKQKIYWSDDVADRNTVI